jgi:hypothetical protein
MGRAAGVFETSSDGVEAVDGGVSACIFVELDILGGAGEKGSFIGTGEEIAAGAGACCANGGGTWVEF